MAGWMTPMVQFLNLWVIRIVVLSNFAAHLRSNMAGTMTRMAQFLNLWVIRIVVLSSFAAHLVLALFAGIRRRKPFGWRTILLWLAYQGGGWAATSALGNLTLGRTLREQQLITFWTPFLLLHLGGPDNISAYSLEDNVLSARQLLNVAAQVAGATYGLYKHIIIGSDGGLLWASVIMFFFGVGKYVEKALALWRGDLGSIRSSIKKPSSGFTERVGLTSGQELDNERALLVAHDLFHISKGAFVDYSVMEGDINGRICSSYGWKGMCKVVEMELSLMYDILYTKAAVVHTWFGYSIRVASPLATAAAWWLFCLYNKDGQRRGDVVITYILLVATFLLDLIWLLAALGSTWTYAFLNDRPGCTGSGRWHRFHHFIVSLHPCRLLAKEPTSYRLWSGYIGRYNLLQECTHDTTSQWRALAKKVGLEDGWMEYQYHYSRGHDILPDVSELLFEQIWNFLRLAYPPEVEEKEPVVEEKDDDEFPDEEMSMASLWPRREEDKPKKEGIVRTRRELEKALDFDPEFQEDILIFHIATDVFLLCRDQNAAYTPHNGEGDQGASRDLLEKYVKAIKALSDYMVFLVAVRPNMLPGLKLRSTYEATREALEQIWDKKLKNKRESPQSSRDLRQSSSSSRIWDKKQEEELATILRDMEKRPGSKQRKPRNGRPPGHASVLYDESIILSDGTKLAEELLEIAKNGDVRDQLSDEIVRFLPDLVDIKRSSETMDMQLLLVIIFMAWVRMLIFVSVRCSRDSHAKQLSRGGELTTIVWILAEHAAILRIRS